MTKSKNWKKKVVSSILARVVDFSIAGHITEKKTKKKINYQVKYTCYSCDKASEISDELTW